MYHPEYLHALMRERQRDIKRRLAEPRAPRTNRRGRSRLPRTLIVTLVFIAGWILASIL